MSQESRTIRPFVGLSGLESIFSEALLYFGPASCPSDSSIHEDLQPHEFLRRPVQIAWASDDESFDRFKQDIVKGAVASDFALSDLDLVVISSNRYLKLAELVACIPLTAVQNISRVVDLTGTPRKHGFSTPFSGFHVDAYVVLSRSLAPRPLRPSRKGTWLARARFTVNTYYSAVINPPIPLSEELRRQLRLPPKTMRYLNLGDHDLLQPFKDQEQPVFYVDEELLAQLNARRTAASSKMMQVQLVHDFVSTLIWRASSLDDLGTVTYADVQDSLLGNIIRIAAGVNANAADRNSMLRKVKETPGHVIAAVEQAIDIMASYLDVVKDGEA